MKNTLVVLSILFLSMTSYAQKNNSNNTSATRDSLIAKMETLYYRLVSSESYVALQDAQEIYHLKVNMKLNSQEMLASGDIKGWVRANLERTSFKTEAQADAAYDTYIGFVATQRKENNEYFEFLMELLSQEDGQDIWKEAMVNVMEKHPEKFEKTPLQNFRRRLGQ